MYFLQLTVSWHDRNTPKNKSPFACVDMVEIRWILRPTVNLNWQQRLVSDEECYLIILMERCWFAGVKYDMKELGVQPKRQGRCARGRRWRRCGGGDLIGDGLWYCYASFSLENCCFTVLLRDFSGHQQTRQY